MKPYSNEELDAMLSPQNDLDEGDDANEVYSGSTVSDVRALIEQCREANRLRAEREASQQFRSCMCSKYAEEITRLRVENAEKYRLLTEDEKAAWIQGGQTIMPTKDIEKLRTENSRLRKVVEIARSHPGQFAGICVQLHDALSALTAEESKNADA